jgi:hypothetical protein
MHGDYLVDDLGGFMALMVGFWGCGNGVLGREWGRESVRKGRTEPVDMVLGRRKGRSCVS